MLSCHDDELDDRRVAFIYYLVPESWNEGDGGRLQLFSLDGIGTILEYLKIVESFSVYVNDDITDVACRQNKNRTVHFSDNGEPKEIVKNLIPVQNSFVFFEVTPASFHQVKIKMTITSTGLLKYQRQTGSVLL